jgi:tetraacyldisaccharide 4'-kinase
MALIDTLESAWYANGRAPWWAAPLSMVYGAVIRLRRRLYASGVLRSVALPVPVIVIGNLSVGGTGKTPLTMAVVQALRDRGYRPGVVSRGYGGSQREPMLLSGTPDPAQVGDEPCLIAVTGVPVAVGRNRPAAAKLLIDAGCNVIVADDGLQHYRLARDLEICVIDGVRRFGNGRLLPAGPLREPISRLRRVELRVCNGGVADDGEYLMLLRGDDAFCLRAGEQRSLASFAGQRVHAVAAIGHPRRFFDSLRRVGIDVIEHAFADHHRFVAADLNFTDDLPLLMTDKDAVKCQTFAKPHWWRVPVRADLPEAFYLALIERMRRAATRRDDRSGQAAN